MAEISFNQVYDGVTLTLHRAFPKARIHGGSVEQGLKDGDFNVLPLSANHTAEIGSRASRRPLFDVIYYPSRAGGRAECLQIADKLPQILSTITTPNGDVLHCTTFDITIEEDALHATVGYTHFVYTPQEQETMNHLYID